MEPQEFLAAVLPSTGHYCTVELSTKKKQHIFVEDLTALEKSINKLSRQSKNTYFALATFGAAGSREAANASYVRAIFIDLDIGAGEKTYSNKREAVMALNQFLVDTELDTLGAPWIVDSGGGIHAYWPLDKDATVAEWRPVAEAFKVRAKELGFRIDMTVTADAARVLRPPGTLNHKYDPPRPVLLKFRGAIFSLARIAALLGSLVMPVKAAATDITLPGKRPVPVAASNTMRALAGNSTTLFKNIIVRTVAGTGCGQVAHYIEHAKEDGMEPLWRGMLSLAARCDDGQQASLKLTRMHPYDVERMQQKLLEIKGPYPCTALDSNNPGICGDCPHWGKITNPLALGRSTAVEDTEKVYTDPQAEDNSPGAHITRPAPPMGYSYGANGGIYRKAEAVDGVGTTLHMVVPFDFFMVDMLQEGTTYYSRFAAVRPNSVVYVTVPNRASGSKDEVIKVLASQNIIASYGAGNDQHLFNYVRTCIGDASAGDTALRVPPNMGWQADGGFAISDQMLLPNNLGYTFVSDNLTNIINATATKGTLGDWQRVMHMLQAKEQWGLLFFAAIGFGSPLMQWIDEGTPGMTYHVCGSKSGQGKTLALLLCASIWGSPKNYPVIPTTSERTMMQRAGLLGNLPLLIDEVTTNSRDSKNEFVPRHAFAFSQGSHKIKGSGASNSELDNNLFWNALCMLTSNDPQMEAMMGARDTTSEGEVRRMLEWVTTSVIEWTDAERTLLELINVNYGHAGRKYAQWLVDNADLAKSVLAATQRKWRSSASAKDSERFWNAGCSAVLAGAILAGPAYANVFAFDTVPLASFAHSLVAYARGVIESNQYTAEDILNAYTRENSGLFVKIGPEESHLQLFGDNKQLRRDSTRGKVAGRVEYGVRPGMIDYFIEISMLKRYCATRNWGYRELLRGLSEKMAVSEMRRNLLAQTNGPDLRVACIHIAKPIENDETEPT